MVRQPIGSGRSAAKRSAAWPQTMGFRRLHNLPRSLIHFNYLIHLLCNLHNLSDVSNTVYDPDAAHAQLTMRKMLTAHRREREREAVLNTFTTKSFFFFFKFRKSPVHTASMCDLYEYKLLLLNACHCWREKRWRVLTMPTCCV